MTLPQFFERKDTMTTIHYTVWRADAFLFGRTRHFLTKEDIDEAWASLPAPERDEKMSELRLAFGPGATHWNLIEEKEVL